MINKLTIPSGWNEVPVGMFQELANLDRGKGGLLKVIDMISILSDTDSEEIKKIQSSDLDPILEAMAWTSESPKSDFKTEVNIQDKTYYLIKLSDASIAENADLETYASDINQLHKFFAVLYRPVGEEYNVTSMLERADLFQDKLMISDVYGTLVFFLNIANQYEIIIKTYSNQQ